MTRVQRRRMQSAGIVLIGYSSHAKKVSKK